VQFRAFRLSALLVCNSSSFSSPGCSLGLPDLGDLLQVREEREALIAFAVKGTSGLFVVFREISLIGRGFVSLSRLCVAGGGCISYYCG
jgi:hypothetical protein